SERQNLVLRRLLNFVDPATAVVDAVAAATIDVEVYSPIVRQLFAGGVARGGGENRAIELAVAAAASDISRGAVTDHKNDSVPAGVSVVSEVAGDNQDAVARVRAQVETAVHVNHLWIVRRHVCRPSGTTKVVGTAAVVVARRIRRVRDDRIRVLLD